MGACDCMDGRGGPRHEVRSLKFKRMEGAWTVEMEMDTMIFAVFEKLQVHIYSKSHAHYNLHYNLHKDTKHVMAIHSKFTYYISIVGSCLRLLKWCEEKVLKKIDHIGCKILALEVKKKTFFISYKIGSTKFESSWFETFILYKVEAFDIMLRNWIKNPKKKKKPNLYIFLFFKRSLSRKRYVIKEKKSELLIMLAWNCEMSFLMVTML